MSLAEGEMVGPYRLERLLGRGGMAVVYEATHVTVGRTVALKLMAPDLSDPGMLERFHQEGRMQATLDHPHVVTIYEAGTSEFGPYLAMRLVRGTTLAGLIDAGSLTAARTLDLLGHVADALDAAHAAGLVHRDVKPRNVLVDGDDAYLADFGLTRSGDTEGVTATGQFMGTIAYVAPEVISGGASGPAADRYALAAVLFECLTGTPVFPRPTQAAVLFAHTHEPPPRVSGRREGIPPGLDEVLIAGLAKEPGERPGRAGDLIAQARAALAGTDLGPPAPRTFGDPQDATTAGQVTVPSRTAPAPGRRRGGRLAVAGVAGALAGGGAVALLTGGDDPPARAATAVPLPAAPAGSVRLGSDLTHAGRTVQCKGQVSCSVVQDRLPDAALVVPRNGVLRRWGVRSARGEFALTVLRDRDDGSFQIARTANEFVDGPAPHFFAADINVERGDRLALVAIGDSGYGLLPQPGATTAGWAPPLAGLIRPQSAGSPGELLLRADYVPGQRAAQPVRLIGAAAAAAPDGTVLARQTVKLASGNAVDVRLVTVDGAGRLDYFRDGRRTVRIGVPGLHGEVDPSVVFVFGGEEVAGHVGTDVEWRPLGSDRVLHHYFGGSDRHLRLID